MITIIVIKYTKPAILYHTKSEYIPIFRPKKEKKKKCHFVKPEPKKKKNNHLF